MISLKHINFMKGMYDVRKDIFKRITEVEEDAHKLFKRDFNLIIVI